MWRKHFWSFHNGPQLDFVRLPESSVWPPFSQVPLRSAPCSSRLGWASLRSTSPPRERLTSGPDQSSLLSWCTLQHQDWIPGVETLGRSGAHGGRQTRPRGLEGWAPDL